MKEHQNYSHFSLCTDPTSSSPCAILLNSTDDHQKPINDYYSIGGSELNYEFDQTNDQRSVKWISSKMRIMNKIPVKKHPKTPSLQPNHASSNNNNSLSDIIRICSSCKTTKTPLWRSGPQGPKSLCNACGIRQMKARRAMRAAAERSSMDQTVPFKKRFKFNMNSSSSKMKMKFEDMTLSLSSKLAFHQAFPQEEKDAAILLMALSCGFVHG